MVFNLLVCMSVFFNDLIIECINVNYQYLCGSNKYETYKLKTYIKKTIISDFENIISKTCIFEKNVNIVNFNISVGGCKKIYFNKKATVFFRKFILPIINNDVPEDIEKNIQYEFENSYNVDMTNDEFIKLIIRFK